MKKNLLILIAIFTFSQLKAQSIIGVNYSPVSPTTIDTIYFYVDLVFPSSGCPLSNSASSVIGQTVMASSLHCLGMLAAICNTTDTFMVLPLAAGNYTFDMTLSSGMGPVPCSPGIVPNDNRTENFTVSTITEVSFIEVNTVMEIGPNPSTGVFNLTNFKKTDITVYDILGNEVISFKNLNKNYSLDLTNFPKGMYLLKTNSNNNTQCFKIFKK